MLGGPLSYLAIIYKRINGLLIVSARGTNQVTVDAAATSGTAAAVYTTAAGTIRVL